VPELPEVETVVRMIRPKLRGCSIIDARFAVPRQLRPQTPQAIQKRVRNQRVHDVRRRGKHILIELERGALIFHLGMTGTMYVGRANREHHSHERATVKLDNGYELVLRDPRTFGRISFIPSHRLEEVLNKLGWEPLTDQVNLETLREKLASRSIGIKPLLLNQSLWAGIGNIYASEILWEARIHPMKPAQRLTRAECERIIAAVPAVLQRALDKGGSSIRDFMSPDGEAGAYQKQFRVYDRAGKPCRRCSGEIVRVVQAQRSTYYCKGCQKRHSRG
jgi:formamidopyrimidine-DNA glycosylase